MNLSTTLLTTSTNISDNNISLNPFITGIIGSIFLLIIVLAICGNILVCIAISTDAHLKHLSNTLYVSLAVADLLVASFVMTLSFIDFIYQKWIFNRPLCKIYISMDIMCSTASILNILATAIDRYIHIHQPFQYTQIVTSYRVFFVLLIIWLISGLMSFVPIHLKWHIVDKSQTINQSLINDSFVCAMKLNPSYAIISSIISFYLPCFIMVALYIKLYRFARLHMEKINAQTNKTNVADQQIYITTNQHQTHKMLRKKIKTDQKAAITLGVIMGTFLCCWLPFFVLNCINPICECIPDSVFLTVTWLGYFNSCLNPIIYPLFNNDFRAAYKKILQPLLKHCCSRSWIDSLFKIQSNKNTLTNSNNNSGFVSTCNINGAEVVYLENDYNNKINMNRKSRKEISRYLPVSQKYRNFNHDSNMHRHSMDINTSLSISNSDYRLSDTSFMMRYTTTVTIEEHLDDLCNSKKS